ASVALRRPGYGTVRPARVRERTGGGERVRHAAALEGCERPSTNGSIMRVALAAVLVLVTVGAGSARAQTADEQVRLAVQQAADGLAARDTAALLELFDPSATLLLIQYGDSGTSRVVIPARNVIEGLAAPGPQRREQFRN